MDRATFIKKIIGTKWINRASSFEGCDCWGLVILYYRHVLSIELPPVVGYCDNADMTNCWRNESRLPRWAAVDNPSRDGLVFTCYKGAIPTHVGVTIGDGKVLHSNGTTESGGVQVNSIRAIESMYGRMTYHKFIEQDHA